MAGLGAVLGDLGAILGGVGVILVGYWGSLWLSWDCLGWSWAVWGRNVGFSLVLQGSGTPLDGRSRGPTRAPMRVLGAHGGGL